MRRPPAPTEAPSWWPPTLSDAATPYVEGGWLASFLARHNPAIQALLLLGSALTGLLAGAAPALLCYLGGLALGVAGLVLTPRPLRDRPRWRCELRLRRALHQLPNPELPALAILDPRLRRAGLDLRLGHLTPEVWELLAGLAPTHPGSLAELVADAEACLTARP